MSRAGTPLTNDREYASGGGYGTPPRPPPKSQAISIDLESSLASRPSVPERPAQLHSTSISDVEGHVPLLGSNGALPAIGWLPADIHTMSTNDIKTLLQNPDMTSAILNDPLASHPIIAASKSALEDQLQINLNLARGLEVQEARLITQRADSQSRLLSLRALEQQHRAKVIETEHALRSFSPIELYQRLHAGVIEQESVLRGIEESFLDANGVANDQDVTDFIKQVREAKRLAFLRSERKKRWDEGRVGGWH